MSDKEHEIPVKVVDRRWWANQGDADREDEENPRHERHAPTRCCHKRAHQLVDCAVVTANAKDIGDAQQGDNEMTGKTAGDIGCFKIEVERAHEEGKGECYRTHVQVSPKCQAEDKDESDSCEDLIHRDPFVINPCPSRLEAPRRV